MLHPTPNDLIKILYVYGKPLETVKRLDVDWPR